MLNKQMEAKNEQTPNEQQQQQVQNVEVNFRFIIFE